MSGDRAARAALGLGPAEEAAYELVACHSASTLDELIGRWSRPEPLPDALAALEDAGLVSRRAGEPARYAVADPDLVLPPLLADWEERLDAAHEHARRLAAAYQAAHDGPGPGTVIEVVSGHRAVLHRLSQLQYAARRQVCCVDKPPALDPDGAGTVLDLLAAGVSYRCLHETTAVGRPDALAGIERLARAGQQVRVLPDLPMRLYLVDDRFGLLPLRREPAEPVEAAVVVHPSALLDALATLFDGLWRRAVPLHLPPAGGAAAGVAGRKPAAADEQRLVALLLSGLTDQTIARQLGCGYRTVQRRIAALMADLGAHTRFQAGAQAAFRRQQPGVNLDASTPAIRKAPTP
ncbi:MAG: helix-turn-helix domain-containing protein [Mycobacteriales bacterium]